jgi:hypothetical protein
VEAEPRLYRVYTFAVTTGTSGDTGEECELELAKLLRTQGVVSSLCPIHTTAASGLTPLTDPLFGYNPAIEAIVERAKGSLAKQ